MTPTLWSRISMITNGDDLLVVALRRTPRGVIAGPPIEIANFLDQTDSAIRAALRGLPRTRDILFTCAPEWCALHPMGLTLREWRSARDEVIRSIDSLTPIEPGDALAGLIRLESPDDEALSMLFAARRSVAQPWLDRIERGLERPVRMVLAPSMAMLGLGAQERDRTLVDELNAHGERIATHRFTHGAPVELDVIDPDPEIPRRAPSARELAIAAGLAPIAGAGWFAPLAGPAPTTTRRWLAPVGVAAAAALLAIAATPVFGSRVRDAADALADEERELIQEVAESRQLRDEATRYLQLLNDGRDEAIRSWRSPLPDLAELGRILGPEDYLRGVDIEPGRISARGEAVSAARLLEALESSHRFDDAALTQPTTRSSQSGLDLFSISATREAPAEDAS